MHRQFVNNFVRASFAIPVLAAFAFCGAPVEGANDIPVSTLTYRQAVNNVSLPAVDATSDGSLEVTPVSQFGFGIGGRRFGFYAGYNNWGGYRYGYGRGLYGAGLYGYGRTYPYTSGWGPYYGNYYGLNRYSYRYGLNSYPYGVGYYGYGYSPYQYSWYNNYGLGNYYGSYGYPYYAGYRVPYYYNTTINWTPSYSYYPYYNYGTSYVTVGSYYPSYVYGSYGYGCVGR